MNNKTGLSIAACLLAISADSQAQEAEILNTKANNALANVKSNDNDNTTCIPEDGTLQENIVITANKAQLNNNQDAEFIGNVSLCHQDSTLKADKALVSKKDGKIEAEGDIQYQNAEIDVKSRSFEANFDNSVINLGDADYQLAENRGRGKAGKLVVDANEAISLQDATFSTCPIGDDSWQLHADEITLTQDGWGEAWNAVFKIKDTPVIYLPYLSFPVDSRRITGFLHPNISNSGKYGVDVRTPYYWNIAPNYDATITPRYMSKRGFQLQTEFRYLNDKHKGTLNIEWLNRDKEQRELGSRYLFMWQNKSALTDNIRAFVDFADVSDDAYLADMRPIHYSPSDTQLYKQLEVTHFGEMIQSTFRLQDFEILGNHTSAYKALPQISLSNTKPIDLGPFEFNIMGELSHFRNEDAEITSAERLHIQPSLSLPYHSPAITALAEVSLLQTFYNQRFRHDIDPNTTIYDDSVTRSIPQVRLYSKFNFQRDLTWGDSQFLNTFEPQVQYLYSPYEDQSMIGNYDSTRLQDDYYGLFRNNRFSGLDRVAEANQLAIGATTRLYNKLNEEIFHLSFGQIFYFSRNNNEIVKTPTDQASRENNSTSSALAGDLFVRWSKAWSFYGELQFDSEFSDLQQSNLSLEYRTKQNTWARLNHRYSRNVSGFDIEQLGLTASYPIRDNLQFVGGYTFDLTNKRSIESYTGIQYESCCWAVRAVWRRNIDTNLDQFNQVNSINAPFDSGFSIQFSIKSAGNSNLFNLQDIRRTSVFGFRRPYFIND